MAGAAIGACDACTRRAWLLARLAGNLDLQRSRIDEALELGDRELIAAVGGQRRLEIAHEHDTLDTALQRSRCDAVGLAAICRCDARYPARLSELAAPPAVLHVAGGLERFLELVADQPVAIVGTRRPSSYGAELARSLGRGVVSAGVSVISGMAAGIDSAAHAGALAGGTATVAVLPGGAERPYPAAARALYRRIVGAGAAISELPPGIAPRRWMFLARNRIIAALASITVVVEAGERSGALVTASHAAELGRAVGAVPGRTTTTQATGPHRLLRSGAALITDAQDVLDELFGSGVRVASARNERPVIDRALAALLAAIDDGHGAGEAIALAGFGIRDGLAALSSLELGGYVRREAGGRYTVVP